jgi:Fur family ferric uptake transcriptional regulator
MERNTHQRQAILQALQERSRPLSPQELLKAARLQARGLGMATVYRTIKALLKERSLASVKLPGQPARYELAGKRHHHHFECRACGKIFEVDGCSLKMKGMTPTGLRVESHELFLYGTCKACAG